MEKSGYGRDGVFRPLRPPLVLPKDLNLSLVSFLFSSTSSLPSKPALIDAESSETLSFSQLNSLVIKLSHAFRHHLGLAKNDVVLIFAPNSIHFPVFFLATIAAGAVATLSELSKVVKDSNPKIVITVPELWDKVKPLNLPAVVIGPEGCSSSLQSSSRVAELRVLITLYANVTEFPDVAVKQSDTAVFLYSSGMTGLSKGVVLTHGNFISSMLMVTQDQEVNGETGHVFLCVLPMFHVFGLTVITYSQLRKGNAVVSMSRFNLERILMMVEKYRVTHLWVVPPIVLALSKDSVVKKYDISSLKHIGSGAAPLGKELMEECAKVIPQGVVVQGYGMTKTSGIVSVENILVGPRNSGSAGSLVSGVESQIVSVDILKPLRPKEWGDMG